MGRVGAGDGGGRGGPHSAVAPAPSALLRTAFLLLLLVSATWLLGLLAVNGDVLTFHYLFAVFSCLQVGGWGGTRRGRPWGGQGSPVLPPAPGETLDLPSRLRPCSPDTRDHAAAVWRCARGYGNASRSCRETRLCPQPPPPPPPGDPAPRPPVSVRTKSSAQLERASRSPSPVSTPLCPERADLLQPTPRASPDPD